MNGDSFINLTHIAISLKCKTVNGDSERDWHISVTSEMPVRGPKKIIAGEVVCKSALSRAEFLDRVT